MAREELDKDMIESIEMWLHECEPKYVEKELAWLDELRTRLLEEKSEKPVPNDLEEAAEEWAKENYGVNYMDFDFTQDAAFRAMYHFQAGAKWQANHTPLPEDTVMFNKGVEEGKRLMMEEAVEARVIELGLGDTPHIILGLSDEFKKGDKVRIIIVKE